MTRRYVIMIANVLLYLAVTVLAVVIYNEVVNPLVDWGTFGTGEQLPAQVFIVLVVAIALSWAAFKLKYAWIKPLSSPGFIRMQRFAPLSAVRSLHMITVGTAFALLITSAIKLLLHHGYSEFASFTDQYADVPAAYLIASAVIGTALELILFIGIMFNEAHHNVADFWTVLVVSIIIAALQPGGIAMQLLGIGLGFLYGYMYIRLKTIWSVILIGCSFNVIFFTFVKTAAYDWFGGLHPSLLTVIIGISAIYMVISVLAYGAKRDAA
ncbi:type II CAAX prenyl endopeptidase Rce1 family protein [Paenibacillus montanisoli]|uniref:CAAX prenyl protease 2/Lysostaphin resistance protein A-like domain-containing protein n=1 Tax=Paenibacillus montanisoli TaxID=2081970 RepID=A0A328U3N8_9BACL|nr:CPBP family glutamic-type intramembrane protease [Paenibacillus montanisoli]RAP74604.1 hypothetical protein DL346_21325 [Paenibacillus montanisoli]